MTCSNDLLQVPSGSLPPRDLFVCLSAGFLVTNISGVGWRRAMKFYRIVDLGVHQVISPLVNLGPWVSPLRLLTDEPSFSYEKLGTRKLDVCHHFSYEFFLVRET